MISYCSYIVIAQRELTVSVAFTAISLFTMLRMPLNVIPTYVGVWHCSLEADELTWIRSSSSCNLTSR